MVEIKETIHTINKAHGSAANMTTEYIEAFEHAFVEYHDLVKVNASSFNLYSMADKRKLRAMGYNNRGTLDVIHSCILMKYVERFGIDELYNLVNVDIDGEEYTYSEVKRALAPNPYEESTGYNTF